MRKLTPICIALVALIAAALAYGGFQDWLAGNAIAWQRDAQNALAGALRALRGGQPGAVTGFLALCFTHGFLHALGPGHGKAVIAAYAAASPSSLRRLIGLAAVTSLAQAAVAVVLVYAAIWLIDGARDRVEGLAGMIEPLSFAMIAVLGVMLFWRGARRLRGTWRSTAAAANIGPDHNHGPHCGCGHSHAPEPEALAKTRDWREAAALILGVALRPCTSALFLLILTWRLDLDLLGILGAFVMGIGTMMVTASAGLIAALMRRGVFLALPGGRSLVPAVAMFELMLGASIAALAGVTALRLV
ncbi:nickel/cobalt transporter [Paracoccus xiamenensis]|uniref:nickel/cobalt transporter n=1 Tax=Paracoccus xiamenensis TaxID=2714901 RepID=UPI00140E7744|nr:high frequency lysogenization protein HflD [Paracoccus xiamenensis]NHF74530.1 high frequency lysogenization protein HflD [Paracoccus xiamenensis]